jgi:hypothetical protein
MKPQPLPTASCSHRSRSRHHRNRSLSVSSLHSSPLFNFKVLHPLLPPLELQVPSTAAYGHCRPPLSWNTAALLPFATSSVLRHYVEPHPHSPCPAHSPSNPGALPAAASFFTADGPRPARPACVTHAAPASCEPNRPLGQANSAGPHAENSSSLFQLFYYF